MKGCSTVVIIFVIIIIAIISSEQKPDNKKKDGSRQNLPSAKVVQKEAMQIPAEWSVEPKNKSFHHELVPIKQRLETMFKMVRNADGVVQRLQLYAEFDAARRESVKELVSKILEDSRNDEAFDRKGSLYNFIDICDQITMTGPVKEMFKFDQIELEQAIAACRVQLEETPDLALLETERELKKVLDEVLKYLADNHVLKTSITQATRELNDLDNDLQTETFRGWLLFQQNRIVGRKS